MYVLIGIVMIDRDEQYIDSLYNGILKNISKDINYEIIIVMRETDLHTIKKWEKYNVTIKIVKHYDIIDRHNIEKIAEKRNIIREHAIKNNFDYIWFIDSDIVVKDNYLKILLNGICQNSYKVSYIPYIVKWLNIPAIGSIVDKQLKILNVLDFDTIYDYEQCHVIGFGMTLLHKDVFKYNIESFTIKIEDVVFKGEDFDFCLKLLNDNKKICFFTKEIAIHL